MDYLGEKYLTLTVKDTGTDFLHLQMIITSSMLFLWATIYLKQVQKLSRVSLFFYKGSAVSFWRGMHFF